MKKILPFFLPFLFACPKNPDLPAKIPEVAADRRFEMYAYVYDETENVWYTITSCIHTDAEIPAEYWQAHCRVEKSKEKPEQAGPAL